jgi:hypothetical protein
VLAALNAVRILDTITTYEKLFQFTLYTTKMNLESDLVAQFPKEQALALSKVVLLEMDPLNLRPVHDFSQDIQESYGICYFHRGSSQPHFDITCIPSPRLVYILANGLKLDKERKDKWLDILWLRETKLREGRSSVKTKACQRWGSGKIEQQVEDVANLKSTTTRRHPLQKHPVYDNFSEVVIITTRRVAPWSSLKI